MPVLDLTGVLPILLDGLDVNDGIVYATRADISVPPPQPKPIYATSFATEGSVPASEAHYENRDISFTVRCYGSDELELESAIGEIYRRLGQINLYGGELAVTLPSDRIIYFDLVQEAQATVDFGPEMLRFLRADVNVVLQARPFWRMPEMGLGPFLEISKPALVFTVNDVPGDVQALGRLKVTELAGANKWQLDVALQAEHYDTAPTAALFYEAEELSLVGTSTVAAGAAGVSHTSVVRNTNLATDWQTILSSQMSGGGSLSHVGTFRVKARVYRPTSNTGYVSLRMKWGEGDFRQRTRNQVTTYPPDTLEGGFTTVDLGVVHLSKVPVGDQEWRFDIEAKSTVAGDEIDLDCFVLNPTDEGYAELSAIDQIDDPVTHSAGTGADDATVGTVAWTNPGNITASDGVFAVTGTLGAVAVSHWLKATNFGFAIPTGAVIRGIVAEVQRKQTPPGIPGPVSPWVADNAVRIVKGGTIQATDRSSPSLWPLASAYASYGSAADLWGQTWTAADLNASTFGVALSARNTQSTFATGASVDHIRITVYYTEIVDAAVFASQTAELRHDRAIREDSTGSTWTDISKRSGPYLRLLPGTNRLVVTQYRNDPNIATNDTIDDMLVELWATPRGLVVPSA